MAEVYKGNVVLEAQNIKWGEKIDVEHFMTGTLLGKRFTIDCQIRVSGPVRPPPPPSILSRQTRG